MYLGKTFKQNLRRPLPSEEGRSMAVCLQTGRDSRGDHLAAINSVYQIIYQGATTTIGMRGLYILQNLCGTFPHSSARKLTSVKMSARSSALFIIRI